jgi:ligand-binding sensor domain-containing protein
MSSVRRFDGKTRVLRVSNWFLSAAIIFCTCVSNPAAPAGESDSYLFDIWTTDNGLPQNSVNAVLQTKDGYLWLATFDGLVRYDGVRLVIFNVHNTPGSQ